MVHVPLDGVVQVGAVDTAERAGRSRVRVDEPGGHPRRSGLVDAARAVQRDAGQPGHLPAVGAVVGDHLQLAGDDRAVLVERGPHAGDRALPAGAGEQVLGAGVDELDRPPPRRLRQQRGVRLQCRVELGAEPAADRVPDDAHRGRPDVEELRHPVADVVGELVRRVDGVAAVAVGPDRALGLDVGLVLALHHELVGDDPVGPGEGVVDPGRVGHRLGCEVPVARVVGVGAEGRDVALPIGMHERRVGTQRRVEVDHRGQRLDLEHDGCRGLPGQLKGVGRHRGDRLALVEHPVGGEQPLIAQHPAGPGVGRVRRRDHGVHPGHRQRRRGVEPGDPARADGRAHQRAPDHARLGVVDAVLGVAAGLRPPVAARDALADDAHRRFLPEIVAATASRIWL